MKTGARARITRLYRAPVRRVHSQVGPRHAFAGGVLLALVAGGLFFQDLGRYPLWDPDEARHAEIAREMAAAHGWRRLVLPTLELAPYREKPPGHYWLVSLAYTALGVDAGAARTPSAVAAWLLVMTLYAWTLPRAGVAGALGAGLVAATSAGWLGLARYANLDMTFTACVTLGVLAGLAWLERPPPRRPPFVPYVAAAAGTLVKGPLAVLLVAGPLGLAALTRRPRPTWRELGFARGIAAGGAIVALVVVPMALLDPETLRGLAATNVRRLAATSPHAAPVWYYGLWLPILFLPWTLLAPVALVDAARDPDRRALVAWAAFVPLVLTLARGKLATYVLPALPPLALVVGPALARVVARRQDMTLVTRALRHSGCLGVLVLGVAAAAAAVAALATAALAWALALASVLTGNRQRAVPLALLDAVVTQHPVFVRFAAPAVSALHSDHAMAKVLAQAGPAPVIAFGSQAPSLVFYLGTPVVHTEDPRLVRDLFDADAPAFVVTGRRHVAEIEALLGSRGRLWYATPRRRLYGNHPPPG